MPAREEIDASAIWRAIAEGSRPIVGWLLTAMGAVAIALGYLGASRELLVARQLPYLTSGGLAGIALVFLGAILIGTQDVRRYGERLDRLEEMLTDLHEVLLEVENVHAVPGEAVPDPAIRAVPGAPHAEAHTAHGLPREQVGAPPAGEVEQVRTTESPSMNGDGEHVVALPRGATFHRPNCSAVIGKSGVRTLFPEDLATRPLKPCKLCEPDHAVV